METPYGIPICMPPYENYYESVGRMSGMLPGVYENGGIYNHACGFKIMADCKAERKESALASLIKIMPDGKHNPSSITTTEPYVFTNCYLMHETAHTVVGFSWLTGASAWALRGFYEGILGLNRTYDGLKINPQISSSLGEVKARRIFRGCEYEITYKDKGLGKPEILVDGNKIQGNILPVFFNGKVHKVKVEF
jgi:cellobiose phosphorylase